MISLLMFSGIANAYCAIDEGLVPPMSAASAQHSHEDGTADACPGLHSPVKEDAKPCAQWDAVPAAPGLIEHNVATVPTASRPIARRVPIAVPVFRHFPKLLN